MDAKIREQWPERKAPDAKERQRIGNGIRQVEWADTYLQAFANLELEDHQSRQMVHEIRRHLTALELHLRRLQET
jgi:hypothetical protein